MLLMNAKTFKKELRRWAAEAGEKVEGLRQKAKMYWYQIEEFLAGENPFGIVFREVAYSI